MRAAFATVFENLLANLAAVAISQEYVMARARPVGAGVPWFISHAFSPLETASRRKLRRSLYWRSESTSQVRRGLPTEHRLRPIRQGARLAKVAHTQVIKSQGAIGCSRRIGSVQEGCADLAATGREVKRSETKRDRWPRLQKPHLKGTGWAALPPIAKIGNELHTPSRSKITNYNTEAAVAWPRGGGMTDRRLKNATEKCRES
jgi:hypothetical protein